MSEKKKKNDFVDSIISLLIFLVIFLPYFILSANGFMIDFINNKVCSSYILLNIFAWGCIVFIPTLCCYILGKDAIKMYNESNEEKTSFRKIINILNIVSLFFIKLFLFLFFLFSLFFELFC